MVFHTLEIFANCSSVEQVYIVIPYDNEDYLLILTQKEDQYWL